MQPRARVGQRLGVAHEEENVAHALLAEDRDVGAGERRGKARRIRAACDRLHDGEPARRPEKVFAPAFRESPIAQKLGGERHMRVRQQGARAQRRLGEIDGLLGRAFVAMQRREPRQRERTEIAVAPRGVHLAQRLLAPAHLAQRDGEVDARLGIRGLHLERGAKTFGRGAPVAAMEREDAAGVVQARDDGRCRERALDLGLGFGDAAQRIERERILAARERVLRRDREELRESRARLLEVSRLLQPERDDAQRVGTAGASLPRLAIEPRGAFHASREEQRARGVDAGLDGVRRECERLREARHRLVEQPEAEAGDAQAVVRIGVSGLERHRRLERAARLLDAAELVEREAERRMGARARRVEAHRASQALHRDAEPAHARREHAGEMGELRVERKAREELAADAFGGGETSLLEERYRAFEVLLRGPGQARSHGGPRREAPGEISPDSIAKTPPALR